LREDTLPVDTPITLVVPDETVYDDSYLALLSLPPGCPEAKNLYVPIPVEVEPNPTILDLTRTTLLSVL